MIHHYVLADVAAEHRNALLTEGTARRLARYASRRRGTGRAPGRGTPCRPTGSLAAACSCP